MRWTVGVLIFTFLGADPMTYACDKDNSKLSIRDATSGMTKHAGFLPLYTNLSTGLIYLEIPDGGGPDVLYQPILASGFGLKNLSLDRGYLGPSRLVAFRKLGDKVMLIQRNTSYFTPSAGFGAPQDSGFFFPDATLAAFCVRAQESNRLLVDATKFFRQDALGLASALKSAGQGDYRIDDERSTLNIATATSSDRSIEIDSLLTFVTSDPGPDNDLLSNVAADRSVLLVRERHSLIQLPDIQNSGFRSRAFDPRSGYFDTTYIDPSKPPGQPRRESFVQRHRLTKKVPEAAVSDPEQPIVYYIDPSVPKSLHSLIADAVAWWAPAFEAAGFSNALQVKELSAGMDPLAAGVNIIFWEPHSTRAWSYGTVVADPRTGEILKGVVRLDAQRLRTDEVLFDALTAPYTEHPDLGARDEAIRSRVRLLIAHEVGHTLGLRHQFIASTQGMSSVMDYPFPKISMKEGVPTIPADAYPNGIGAWDRQAILYGYQPFSSRQQESEGLRTLIDNGERQGYWWMSDEDVDDAEPQVQKWDLGTDPVAALNQILDLRRAALARFSRTVIAADQPLGKLQDALSPVYLLHQFEVKAVAAMLGGFTYRHAMRDEPAPEPVPTQRQREALKALLVTLDPDTLTLDARIIGLMSPRPVSYSGTDATFSGDTGSMFDPLRAVGDATAITMCEILKPSRTARLAEASTRDPGALGLDEVLTSVIAATWKAKPRSGPAGATQRAIAHTVVEYILVAIADKASSDFARAAYWAAVDDLKAWMKGQTPLPEWKDIYVLTTHRIAELERDPAKFTAPKHPVPVVDPMGQW